jgi:hypothetical protein
VRHNIALSQFNTPAEPAWQHVHKTTGWIVVKMPRSLALALAAVFCLFGAGAQANPKWEAVMLNDQGLFYIDPKSITEEDGRKKVWSALDYKKPQTTGDGKPYLSIHSQIQVNCSLKMARVLHLTYYTGPMLTGKVVSRQGMLHEWLDIDPTSPIQKIARRVC